MMWTNKAIKIISWLAKIAIVICALSFLYIEIFRNDDFASITTYYSSISNQFKSQIGLLIVMLLMPFNWLLESLKWKFLIEKIEPTSTGRAIKAVLSGITISAILPNRMGEFLGRIAYVKKADRIKAALISVLGSLSQLTITVVLGALSLIYFLFFPYFSIEPVISTMLIVLLVGLTILTPVFYFNSSLLFAFVKRQKFLNRFSKYARVFKLYSTRELKTIINYSLLRYVVFTFQFAILLFVFNVKLSVFNSLLSVSASFFVIATIPSPTLVEIGIRESTALYFVGLFSTNSIGIVSAAFTLWIVNIAIPAIIGSVYVLQARFIKTNS